MLMQQFELIVAHTSVHGIRPQIHSHMHFQVNLVFLLKLFLINIKGEYYNITLVSVCIILSGTGQSKRFKTSKKKTHTHTDTTKQKLIKKENYEYYSTRMIQTLIDFLHTELLRG